MTTHEGTTMESNGDAQITDLDTPSKLILFMDVLNAITHICIGAIAFSAYLYANLYLDVDIALSRHIYLCVLGYVVLMGLGIMSLSPYTGWSRTLNFRLRRHVHMTLHALGSILAITGTIIMIAARGPTTSVHGGFGIFAMVLTFISLAGGVLHFFRIKPRITKLFHVICGSLTITVAFLTVMFGFHYYYRAVSGNVSANLLVCFVFFTLIGIFVFTIVKNVKRLM